MGFSILVALSAVCSHFGIGTTGGIANSTALPATGWDAITTGLGWFVNALSFQLNDNWYVISLILWFVLVICILLPIIKLIRGTD
jgi:membrane protein DedA with SNARE-associated domain